MPDNTGFMLLAGLGALLFLGRGGIGKQVDKDNRLITGSGGGGMPMPPAPAFDIQSYIDGIFGQTAGAPVQPPMKFFQPRSVVVTSSGVPAMSSTALELITPTTKVAIGGDGGETITASALAVKRSEQIAQQQFEYAANVQPRKLAETLEANRIEEARQKQFATDLIAEYRVKQAAANAKGSRLVQEQILLSPVEYIPPTITVPHRIGDFTFTGDDAYELLSVDTRSGVAISVPADTPSVEVSDVDFSGISDDEFVMSAGSASPAPLGDFSYYGSEELESMDEIYATPAGYYGGAEDE
jgi:hypothetical protein